jgi:RNA polymerase sigma-70 factor (ECF subfamily)
LSPVERAVFLLSDVFGEPHRRIAEIVGKSEDATRQIASRARRRVHDERDPVAPAEGTLITDLLVALAEGDADRVIGLLHPDVVLTTDAGAEVRAARRPVVGPTRAARFLLYVINDDPIEDLQIMEINGMLSFRFRTGKRAGVLQVESEDGLVKAITMVFNPDKLRHLDATIPLV